MTNRQIIKTNGNRAVVINICDGHVFANLYTNVRNGHIANATITGKRFTGRTEAGALRWTKRHLFAA